MGLGVTVPIPSYGSAVFLGLCSIGGQVTQGATWRFPPSLLEGR